MARSRKKSKGWAYGSAGYGALPRMVWEHPDYCNLSGGAAKLLMDFACQFNGHNNGDLQAAYSVLSKRGWRSRQTISRAVAELLSAELIVKTREGKFTHPGGQCALYALAWVQIHDCDGKLEVAPTSTPPRKFSLESIKTPSPERGLGSVHKRGRQRARDDAGRYQSVHKRVRWMGTA
jgi:hypothetical protein